MGGPSYDSAAQRLLTLHAVLRCTTETFLGDVSVNHTSAVDVVCDCMRVSALCVCVWWGDNMWVQDHVHACKGLGKPKVLHGYLADHHGKRQDQLCSRCSPTSRAHTGDQRFTTVAVGSPTLWAPPLSSPTVSVPPHLASQEHVCLLWTCYTQKLKHSGGTQRELGLF